MLQHLISQSFNLRYAHRKAGPILTHHMSAFSSVTRQLKDLFELTDDQCHVLLHEAKTPSQSLLQTGSYLKNCGVQKDQLLRLPWIIHKNQDVLEKRLSLLLKGDHMFLNIPDCLTLCCYSVPFIERHAMNFYLEKIMLPNHRNRIYFMADKLSVPVPMMSDVFVCQDQLYSMPLQRINEYLKLFNEYNIPREYILQDPSVFTFNFDVSKERLKKFATVPGVGKKRLWITRCEDLKFDACVARVSDKEKDRQLLARHNYSLVQLVASKLSCSVELVEERISAKKLSAKRPSKFNDVIDLLLKHGFSTQQIINNLRVVEYSLKTITERLEQLHQNGEVSSSLHILYAPRIQFEVFLNKRRMKANNFLNETIKICSNGSPGAHLKAPVTSAPTLGAAQQHK